MENSCAIFKFINYNIIIIIIITFIIIIVIISIIVKIIILIIKVHADQITHQDNQTVTLDDRTQNAGTLAENARGKSPRYEVGGRLRVAFVRLDLHIHAGPHTEANKAAVHTRVDRT